MTTEFVSMFVMLQKDKKYLLTFAIVRYVFLQFQRDGLQTSSFFLWKQIQLTLISIIFSFLSIQWEEISNSVWCCPVKVKAAVKDSSSRTGLALALFGLFYPKEELGGRRLHQPDQDIIEAITGISTKLSTMK